jgi:hypothetical protein
MPSSRPLDYQELAKLLDLAAAEHRQLGTTCTDPVASYQFRKSVDFFTAASNAARDYTQYAGRQADLRNIHARPVDAR